MNARQVAQIEERVNGVTPGAWMWRFTDNNRWPLKVFADTELICVMADSQHGGEQELRNAEFIQSAANDMRALLAEVKRLQALELT